MSSERVNSMLFEEEDVEAGKHVDFIKGLLALGLKGQYVDMRVRNEDMGGISVEWSMEPWSRDYGGHWHYVRDDMEERVVRMVELPDGCSVEVDADESDDKVIHEWLEEHKDEGWEKDWLGHWSSAADRKSSEEFMNRALGEGGEAPGKAPRTGAGEGQEGE